MVTATKPATNHMPKDTPAKAKKGFRETAWFKRGELEEELARKAAELSQNDPLAGPSQTEYARGVPFDNRRVGQVNVEAASVETSLSHHEVLQILSPHDRASVKQRLSEQAFISSENVAPVWKILAS